MGKKERYTVKNGKGKIIKQTEDIELALQIKEENKTEGAYIEDRKSPNKHKQPFFH